MKISVIKPSVNNMAVRVLVRAAGLPFEEADAYGQTRTPEFAARNPSFLTPMIEEPGLPKGVLWESCAIMAYLCNRHGLTGFYPADPAQRAMIDSAMYYIVGTLYPYVARACYPKLGFPLYPGEVGASALDDAAKETGRAAAEAAIAGPLEIFRTFFLGDKPFIGGDTPSIADMRLAASLEFMAILDAKLPDWAQRYIAAMEQALGKAYSEPAADVRGYIGWVRSKAA